MMKQKRSDPFRKIAALAGGILLLTTILSMVGARNASHRFAQEQKAHRDTVSQLQEVQKEYRALQDKASRLSSESEELKKENSRLQKQYDRAQKTAARNNVSSAKVAYLTFDDGPSRYTKQLLNTLKSADVHATFFVVGTSVENDRDLIQAERDGGHTVGIHCYSHDYATIYASQKAFSDDYGRMRTLLTGILGTPPDICRFPGGTANTVSNRYGGPHFMQDALESAEDMGLTPFDWNVDSGDADAASVSSQAVVNNIVRQVKGSKRPVILCHDSKKNTVAAIPTVIQKLKSMGYSFGVLSPDAPVCLQKAV